MNFRIMNGVFQIILCIIFFVDHGVFSIGTEDIVHLCIEIL